MGEENQLKNRTRASKFSDQNQAPNTHNANQQKPKSSWGSNIVKGFTADKKTKHQTTTAVPTRRVLQPSSNSESVTQKNPLASSQTRAKRSLIGDLSCSANATQVHPQGFPAHRRQSSGSRDLFTELEHLRGLLQEAKERELKLQAEVEECKKSGRVLELEREVEVRKGEVDDLAERVGLLESEKASLCEQLEVLGSILRANEDVGKKEESEVWKAPQSVRDLEMEVLELRRLNKELQLQKRNLACKLSAMESQLASLSNSHERDTVAKFKAEVSNLRHANEDLSKQVEGLQLSRLNEVEELAYLRWVNSCLRDELRNSCSVASSRKESTPCSSKKNSKSVGSPDFRKSRCLEFSSPKTVKLIKKLREGSITSEDLSSPETADQHIDKTWGHFEERISPQRRHSISGSKCSLQQLMLNKKRHDGFMSQNEMDKEVNVPSAKNHENIQRMDLFGDCPQSNRAAAPLDIEKRALRVPNPPPRPSCSISDRDKEEGLAQIIPPPPPPPPPPPRFSSKSSTAVMQRAPQVVEFYHSLMKRDSRKDYTTGGVSEGPDVESVRSNMIDEIENRSSHLLAIKADVETQGEFVNALIKEVNCAVYQNIEDVVAFVKWLDDELCYLVDERAVLKHFDWPEKKADTLREAAFGYRDLKMLETEILFYEDDPRVPSDVALKKMVTLSEKVERTVYNLHRTRESLMRNCKQFRIPTDWMLDNGIISKIKVGSVKLAKKYMKRVAMEIQSKAVHEKDPSMDYMLLQGVRFAFRIHQFAGGFDSETMHAFEELRDLANLLNRKLMN